MESFFGKLAGKDKRAAKTTKPERPAKLRQVAKKKKRLKTARLEI